LSYVARAYYSERIPIIRPAVIVRLLVKIGV